MISIQHLTVHNRINAASAQFNEGQLHVLLGPNGAGKSSLLAAIAGTLPSGNAAKAIKVDGFASTKDTDWVDRRGFYQTVTQPEFAITVAQMLAFFHCPSRLCHIPDELTDALGLAEILAKDLRECSQGQVARAHLARVILSIWPALQAGNGVLLLDEPLNGLDIQFQVKLLQLLHEQSKNNVVLLAVHDIALVLAQINTAVTLVAKQTVVGQYPVNELANDHTKICDCFTINTLPNWVL